MIIGWHWDIHAASDDVVGPAGADLRCLETAGHWISAFSGFHAPMDQAMDSFRQSFARVTPREDSRLLELLGVFNQRAIPSKPGDLSGAAARTRSTTSSGGVGIIRN